MKEDLPDQKQLETPGHIIQFDDILLVAIEKLTLGKEGHSLAGKCQFEKNKLQRSNYVLNVVISTSSCGFVEDEEAEGYKILYQWQQTS